MNYFADRPINSKDEDLLKRAVFSEKLGDAISAYSGEECLVIGLYGSWGTGKTSIINMALKSINQSGTNKPIVMRFSPWNYTDQNDLISIFFASLYRCLVKQNNEEIKKKVGEALCKYSEAFAMISKFFIGNHSSELLKSASQSLGQYLMNVPDLEKEKENLVNLYQEGLLTEEQLHAFWAGAIDLAQTAKLGQTFTVFTYKKGQVQLVFKDDNLVYVTPDPEVLYFN